MSLASVQSRISSIQDMINSLSNNGRPPVSITESSAAASASKNSATNGAFAANLASQVAAANSTTATRTSGKGEVQGVPGTAEAFVEKVRSYLGVPYVWGGTDPSKGLDCSGLVQTAAREVGVTLPRVTYDQQHAGVEVPSLDQAKPGDLIITRNSGHVVVYIGDGKVIHAPRPGKTVTEASVSDLGPIVTIRRVMRSAGDTPAASTVASANENAKLAATLSANPVVANALNANPASPSTDLASALVGALSGNGAAAGNNAALASLGAGANNNYSSTLLSQFMSGASLGSGNAAAGLGALTGAQGTMGANASLSNTASSLSAVSALRNSLGV